jgi:hypothetical protein
LFKLFFKRHNDQLEHRPTAPLESLEISNVRLTDFQRTDCHHRQI